MFHRFRLLGIAALVAVGGSAAAQQTPAKAAPTAADWAAVARLQTGQPTEP